MQTTLTARLTTARQLVRTRHSQAVQQDAYRAAIASHGLTAALAPYSMKRAA